MDEYQLLTNMDVLLLYRSNRINKHASTGTHGNIKDKERVSYVGSGI